MMFLFQFLFHFPEIMKSVGIWPESAVKIKKMTKDIMDQRDAKDVKITVRAPIKRALQLKTPPHKKMLTFCFYIIFELKFHQKKGHKIIQGARCIGARTVHEMVNLMHCRFTK